MVLKKKMFGTAAEKLIAEFRMRDDVSFIYVTHDVKSGFVTHKATKNHINKKN